MAGWGLVIMDAWRVWLYRLYKRLSAIILSSGAHLPYANDFLSSAAVLAWDDHSG